MRWKGREQSQNVEDRRGISPGAAVGGGGLLVLVIAGIAMLLGADPQQVQQIVGQANKQKQQQVDPAQAPDDDWGEFTRVIMRDTEVVWTDIFRDELNSKYRQPELVLFSDMVDSGCGRMSSKVGPFYCPADEKVYLDPTFFEELARRHNAPGDFAQAYVIGHEVAHHVQRLTGFSQRVDQVRGGGDKLETNRMSVRLELQADYLAGVWAHHAHKKFNTLEAGDIDEGITAAYAIGDDTLMREATGHVDIRQFTHGSSEQRVRWFSEGLRTGDFRGCEALFNIPYERL